MKNGLIFLVILGSTIWFAADTSHLRVKRGCLGGGWADMGVVGWTVATFFLWIVTLPLYLFMRPKYVRRTRAPGVETLISADVPAPVAAPLGWYADPSVPGTSDQLRYWDGRSWTPHVCTRARRVGGQAVSTSVGASRTRASIGETTQTEPPHAPTAPDNQWTDLAANVPGQAVRKKALELRAAAPYRTFVARLFSVHTEERAFRIGADGEEMVARRLRQLDPARWRVLHSLPVGDDVDIDHLVIGPAGVFTLNDKHHPGKRVWVAERTFMVNGQRQPYLPKSCHEGRLTARRLSAVCGFSVFAHPVIVVVDAHLTIRAQPTDVHVVACKSVYKWLRAQSTTLSPEAVDVIYQYARRSTTWT